MDYSERLGKKEQGDMAFTSPVATWLLRHKRHPLETQLSAP